MQRLTALWQTASIHAHKHHRVYHRAHEGTHVAYLAMVAMHGPYNYAAAAMLIVLAIGWLLHLEH